MRKGTIRVGAIVAGIAAASLALAGCSSSGGSDSASGGKVTLPDIDLKRAEGWASWRGALDGNMGDVGAELSFGAIKAYGLPLQNPTLSISSQQGKIKLTLLGVSPAFRRAVVVRLEVRRGETHGDVVSMRHAEENQREIRR